MPILVLNAGSSTLKATLLEPGADEPIGEATVEWPAGDEGASDVVRSSLDLIPDQVDAVGYRVVHGGSHYTAPSLVDESLLEVVDALDALAPLHNRRAAAVMRAGLEHFPGLPHVACFDPPSTPVCPKRRGGIPFRPTGSSEMAFAATGSMGSRSRGPCAEPRSSWIGQWRTCASSWLTWDPAPR